MKAAFLTCLAPALFMACVPDVIAAEAPKSGASAPAKPAVISVAAVETLRDKDIVKIFENMPVLVNGRVKPLDTFARFALLRFHGKQSIKGVTTEEATGKTVAVTDPITKEPLTDADGKPLKLSAVEWLLMTWFRPETARALPLFIVDNSDAVVLLGLHGKGKRDRYSFDEIQAARTVLDARLKKIQMMKQEERSIEDRALGKLAIDFIDYEMMLGHFDFARDPFGGHGNDVPDTVMTAAERQSADSAAIMRKVDAYMQEEWKKFLAANVPNAASIEPSRLAEGRKAWAQQEAASKPWLTGMFRSMFGALNTAEERSFLRVFPPKGAGAELWEGPGTIMVKIIFGKGTPTDDDYANLNRYGKLASASLDIAQFKKESQAFVDDMKGLAANRGEGKHVGLEIHFHEFDYFIKALVTFILGIICLAACWVFTAMKEARPKMAGAAKAAMKLSWILAIAGTVLGTMGIVERCIIMQRPPITNLYETIIFIATTCVIFGLIAEVLTRRTFALLIANVAGMIGMFLSIRFLDMEARDTLQQLEAVLITNFWLSTHVPCINLGYTAGMMACLFSMLYITLRVTGHVKAGDAGARSLGGIAYAFVLVGLFLSLVGTVLGGIWANYSWGRFWGWDPKENGALMIVLMNLVILHARLGNYIRECGFHACNVVLGMITLFSWFATNQLGIGLHAYGELSGAWKWLYISWTIMTAFLIVSIILAQVDRRARLVHKMMAPPLPEPQKA